MWTKLFLLAAAWLIYGLIHSALATSVVKAFCYKTLSISEKLYRILYNMIALFSIIPLIYFGFLIIDQLIFEPNFYSNILGVLFMISGLILMILIIKKYFKQMSGVAENSNQELHINGLHQYVRHPLYLGTFLLLIGLVFFRPQVNVLTSTIAIMMYTIFAIRWEEQKLLLNFGETYKFYCASTPRIIPRFFAKRKSLKLEK